MSELASDGYTEAEARAHPRRDALAPCEACERWFDAGDRRLWVGWSGSSITCVHCFFTAHAIVLIDENTGEVERVDTLAFLAGMSDDAGQSIGGIAGYRARFAASHDTTSCPWAEYGCCLLCDPEAYAEQ